MPRKIIETPVVVPKPKVALKNSGLEIEGQADLDQVLICVLDNKGRPMTQVLRKELCAPIGTQNLVHLNELKWTEQVVPGRTYTIKVMGTDKKGDNSSSEFATVDWSIPAIPAPGNAEPAKDDGSKSPSNPPADDKEAADKLRKIISDQRRALELHARDGSMPAWMDEARLRNMANTTKEIFDQHPGDKTIAVLSGLILTNGKSIREALANASKAAPAKRKPEPKPATTPKPDDHTRIADRVGDLEDNVEEIKGGLEEVRAGLNKKASKQDLKEVKEDLGKKIDGGFAAVGEQIANLNKPATDPKSGASGNGGSNSGGGASGGGKTSAEKQPWSLGGSWIGVIVTLAILLVIGLIALCAFQAGWIHKSPVATTAMYMGATPPIMVVVTNNAVAPVTPPPQAVGLIETPAKVISRPKTVNLDKEGAKEADQRAVGGGNIINSYNTTTYNMVVTNVAVTPAPPAPPVVDSPQPMVSNAVAWASTGEMPYYSPTGMTGPAALVYLSGNMPGFYYPVGTQFLYGYQNPHGHLRP